MLTCAWRLGCFKFKIWENLTISNSQMPQMNQIKDNPNKAESRDNIFKSVSPNEFLRQNKNSFEKLRAYGLRKGGYKVKINIGHTNNFIFPRHNLEKFNYFHDQYFFQLCSPPILNLMLWTFPNWFCFCTTSKTELGTHFWNSGLVICWRFWNFSPFSCNFF